MGRRLRARRDVAATATHPHEAAGEDSREILGFLAAVPLAAGFWFAGAFTWLALLDGLPAAAADVPTLVIGGLILGLPAAALAVILFAGPLYVLLVLLDCVGFATVLFGGAVVGFATAAALDLTIDSGFILPPALGALIGTATAACWWSIARPGSARDERGVADVLPAGRPAARTRATGDRSSSDSDR